MNYFQITAFVNRLKQNKTMSTLKQLKTELEYWKNYIPVNNFGKLAKQTKIDAITELIKNLEVKNQKKNENLFTEEQVREAIEMSKDIKYVTYSTDEIIQSLKQPKNER